MYYLVRNTFHFRDDCAMFLSLSLLEAVSHFSFASRLLLKAHPDPLGAKTNMSHLY